MTQQLSCYLVIGPAGSGLTTALNAFNDFGYLQIGEINPAELENVVASLAGKQNKLAISVLVPSLNKALPVCAHSTPVLKCLCWMPRNPC